jgi:superfamily II DNA or RNA helicase
MHDGTVKAAKEIAANDFLMGVDSSPRRVLSVCSGIDKMYRITPLNGDAFECNEPHILSLVCSGEISKRFTKSSIHNLSVAEYLQLPKSVKHVLKLYKTGVEFPHRETNICPYFMGVWLGDGDSKAPIITNMDKEIEDYIYEYAAKIGHVVTKRPNGDTRAFRYAFKSIKSGWNDGLRGGLTGLKLINNKHIPKQYLINSRAQRLKLLAGLIDTDGYLHHNGYEIFTVSEQLHKDIVYLCRSLGFAVSIAEKPTAKGYRITFGGAGVEEIPVLIPRKKASPRQQIKNALRCGFEVEYIGTGEYNGFELDGDRLFLLGDFTVTHNTVVFTDIIAKSVAKGNRVLVLTHREELLKQASRSLTDFGVSHGLIAAGVTPAYYERAQIASVQTLVNRLDLYKRTCGEPTFIIIDEAHHAVAGSWDTVLAAFPNAKVLGVTATPERLDGKGLGREAGGVFDKIVIGSTVTELIDLGYLATPIVYAPPAPHDKGAIIGDVIGHWRKYAGGAPTVVFCRTVKHAQQVAADFQAAGVRAACVDGTLAKEERQRLLAGLGNGAVQVVTSCDIISEGTDIPAIGCAILLRKTQSLSLYLQQVGRALRVCAGKTHAIILDHVGNSLIHGLPTDEWNWSLAGETQRTKKDSQNEAIKVKQCESCYMVFRPVGKCACPSCGHIAKPKGRKVINVGGELVVVTAEEAQRQAAERKLEVGRLRTLPELIAYQRKHGYKEGWAWAIHNARQGKAKNN